MGSISVAEASFQPSSCLINLPSELQILIYQYCYPRWSLQILDDQDPFYANTPYDETVCDSYSYVPSKNLLLLCREVNKIAAPIFKTSFTGILKVLLTDNVLANEDIHKHFLQRFNSLLKNVHTIDMDFTRCDENQPKELTYNPIDYLPNLKHFVTRDSVIGINVGVLLAENGFGSQCLINGPSAADLQDKRFREFCRQVCDERGMVSGQWWIMMALSDSKEDYGRTLESMQCTYRFRLEGVPGFFVNVCDI